MARAKTKPWHEDDRFWEVAAPVLYPAARAAAAPAEVRQLLELLQLGPGAAVLDQGCGPGWHALAFAREGCEVTGVDRTAAYLARAAGISRVEGLQTRFEHRDVRRYCKPDAFDAVVGLHGAVGMYEDPAEDVLVLRNAFESLRAGGRLALLMRPRSAIPPGVKQEDYREQDGLDLLEERVLPAGSDRQAIRWVLYQGDERFEFNLQVRLYEPAELAAALGEAGFFDVEFFANFVGAAYEDGAPRLVAIARKATSH